MLKKKGLRLLGALCDLIPGGDLRSRVVSNAVSSALQGLTSVFGMGTGVTLAVIPPRNFLKLKAGTRDVSESFSTTGTPILG